MTRNPVEFGMPRHLPPIAPRAPSHPENPPRDERINNPPALPAQPADDPMVRVRALVARPAGYISEPNPFTMALWAALNEPAAVVIQRHADALRCVIEAQNMPAQTNDEGDARMIPEILPRAVTAIQAVMDATVARAIQGDSRARDTIAARIEGNPGARRGDIDPEADAQRQRVRGTIEQLVREMAERAGRRPERAVVIDAEEADEKA